MNPAAWKRARRGAALSLLALSLLTTTGLHAAEAGNPPFNLDVRVGGIWSDNITLSPVNEKSGAIEFYGLVLSRQDDTRRLHSELDVNLGYQPYLNNEFANHLAGGAAGTLNLEIVPGIFAWSAQDNFTRIRIDPLAADAPNNSASANFFTTGPKFTFKLGTSNALSLEGLYSLESYGSGQVGSQRIGGNAGVIHKFTEASSIFVRVETERREFDKVPGGFDLEQDYTTRNGTIGYSVYGRRTGLEINLGYGQVDLGTSTSGAVLGGVSLVRRVTPSSTLQLGVDREYSDTGNSLRAGQGNNGVGLDTDLALGTTSAFLVDTFRLGWQFSQNRTSFTLGAAYSKEGYERVAGLDRHLTRYSASIRRQMRPTLAVVAEFHGDIEEFAAVAAKANEMAASLTLDWAAARTLGWELQYGFRSRGGSGPVERFTENRVSLLLVWSPIASR